LARTLNILNGEPFVSPHMIKLIKTEEEYQSSLESLDELMEHDPTPGTPEANRLELLAFLIKSYEENKYPIAPPSPVEAIKFRIEQQGLAPRDLIPYLGSRSKVSEVLAGKRELSLAMIKALNKGLGIPLESLVAPQPSTMEKSEELDWMRFPVNEMARRKWIPQIQDTSLPAIKNAVLNYLRHLGPQPAIVSFYRKTNVHGSSKIIDRHALMMWTARILIVAQDGLAATRFSKTPITELMRTALNFSTQEKGPLLACKFLSDNGIPVIIESHLPGTRLDGAVVLSGNRPVIGLTLRYDRLDNFWFTLMHELAHIHLHLNPNDPRNFYDDIEVQDEGDADENAANALAGEIMIPADKWNSSIAKDLRTPEAAQLLADELKIHISIVAGKMRHHYKSYRILNNLIGLGEVRKHFAQISWGDK